MNELRKKIAEIVYHKELQFYADETPYTEVDAILSLPSGLVASKDCDHYAKGYEDELCLACHGTGAISRDLTLQDILNDAIKTASTKNCYLQTGERVELKEGKPCVLATQKQ